MTRTWRIVLAALAGVAVYVVWSLSRITELHTQILIEARPDEVWSVLTDNERYHEWNPFIRRLDGNLVEGATLTVEIGAPGIDPMTFEPTVLRVAPRKELRWRGRLLFPGVFDGEHVFQLEPAGSNSTRFVQWEEFHGILVPFFASSLKTDTKRGFEAMNSALKARVETSTLDARSQ